MTWTPDPLGEGFYQRYLELHDDQYGPNRAALVTYRPDWSGDEVPDEALSEPAESDEAGADGSIAGGASGGVTSAGSTDAPSAAGRGAASAAEGGEPGFALLAVHGWNDYFYHYEFAQRVAEAGGRFYALDLRKYGRAHMEGQMWGYVEDLSTYDEEIGEALDVIYDAHGLDVPLFLYGHSTGGLTATLWADRHPGVLHGLILNSPWLELQAATAVRHLGQPILDALHKMAPTAVLPSYDNGFYQRLVTGWMSEEEREQAKKLQEEAGIADEEVDPFVREGGWNPNPEFRQFPSFPIRPGWLRAILHGHERVAEGLTIDCPVLVLTSGKTYYSDTWGAEMRNADTVLDVEQIWKRVPRLGPVTTLVKLEGAIHDVLLSRASVRDVAYWHMKAFTTAFTSPDRPNNPR